MSMRAREALKRFRAECAEKGLAVTHQRVLIFEALMAERHHPSPEDIYERVRRQIPSISLGTVYKNIRTFMEHGLLREVSLHHGTARLETNLHPHHHLVCERCKAIVDLPEDQVGPVQLSAGTPEGFEIRRYSLEVIGICKDCSTKSHRDRSGVPVRGTSDAARSTQAPVRTRPAPSGAR